MTTEEHVLIQDDDGHWYVIPIAKEAEAERYFAAVYTYWRDGKGNLPTEPAWLKTVGGAPSLVKFTGFRIY